MNMKIYACVNVVSVIITGGAHNGNRGVVLSSDPQYVIL